MKLLPISTKRSTSLIKRSRGYLDTFTKALTDLTVINEEMRKEKSELMEKRQLIMGEESALGKEIQKNENISAKIEDFLEVKS